MPLRLPAILLLTLLSGACASSVVHEPPPLETAVEPVESAPSPAVLVMTEADDGAGFGVPEGRPVQFIFQRPYDDYEWTLFVSTTSLGHPEITEAYEDKTVFTWDTTALRVGSRHYHVFGYADPSCPHYTCTDRSVALNFEITDRVDPL